MIILPVPLNTVKHTLNTSSLFDHSHIFNRRHTHTHTPHIIITLCYIFRVCVCAPFLCSSVRQLFLFVSFWVFALFSQPLRSSPSHPQRSSDLSSDVHHLCMKGGGGATPTPHALSLICLRICSVLLPPAGETVLKTNLFIRSFIKQPQIQRI